MIPHEKEMVKRLADSPFALIGINSDGDQLVVQKIIQEQEITWRNIVDGSTKGPIATAWNVHGWPTIYILDAEGKIRYKHLRGQKMEDAVLVLLGEINQT
jgi:hypothetical protein